ncbi:hypothetical protein [Komagataeibacter medellinensis]|uniref:hypothetical protein n=1 Tax=Komagataeibacter medellinensis TaxID=1177712 RepID=UPI0003A8CA4B|nr:hypothetical protein [Komagataeibacter medellinensis]
MDRLKVALAQYCHLAVRRSEEFRMRLARCLLNMTTSNMIFNQYETALHKAHEAAALYTDLTQPDRETYQPLLRKICDQQALIRKKLQR